MIKIKSTASSSNPIHKLGDVVAAISDESDDEYVLGYISTVETVDGKHYYNVEWNNGLFCDSSYDENTVRGFKELLKKNLKA